MNLNSSNGAGGVWNMHKKYDIKFSSTIILLYYLTILSYYIILLYCVSYVKIKIRQLLLRRQKQGDQEEWDESNFSIR